MQPIILVVDDSALTRAVVFRYLANEGYELREAGDGQEALAACHAEPPDVILMDVEMPVLDGHETLAQLKLHPTLHDVPVLFLTGRTDPTDVAEGLRMGAHDYLRKPFEAVELVARVRAAVRLRELQVTLRARNAELERLAAVDTLTGLFNRRFITEQAARTASRLQRHGGSMSVVLVDIDAFKAVNDTHGHAAGDAVLVTVSERLAGALRQEDLLGRWGGEEFIVLAADTDATGAARLAERMRAAVAESPISVGPFAAAPSLVVTVSAGWSSGQEALDPLLQAADHALYAAKAAGRNCVRGGEIAADHAEGAPDARG